jgi:hypothetical protein
VCISGNRGTLVVQKVKAAFPVGKNAKIRKCTFSKLASGHSFLSLLKNKSIVVSAFIEQICRMNVRYKRDWFQILVAPKKKTKVQKYFDGCRLRL